MKPVDEKKVICDTCNGSGHVGEHVCDNCYGSGEVKPDPEK